jgi:Fe2+ transport system protein FeoA
MTCSAVPILRLSDLQAGDSARVLLTDLDPETAHLLRAIGLTSASSVRLCQSGNPCIVQVRSTRIGLSELVAKRIRVVREPGGDARP